MLISWLGLIALTLSCVVSSPAMAQDSADYETVRTSAGGEVYDPLEPVNRGIHGFNRIVDMVILRPVAELYTRGVPQPARKSVTNALNNLNEPVNLLNSLLQGDVEHAFTSFWRFTLNSTLGVAGLFDFAGTNTPLKYRKEDFGQTLGHWGVGPGPYLVLPIIGPSNLRDTTGLVADIFTNPFTYILDDTGNMIRAGVTVVDTRSRALDFTNDVEKNSLDPYVTYRSSYTQYRKKMISDVHPGWRYSRDPVCHN